MKTFTFDLKSFSTDLISNEVNFHGVRGKMSDTLPRPKFLKLNELVKISCDFSASVALFVK